MKVHRHASDCAGARVTSTSCLSVAWDNRATSSHPAGKNLVRNGKLSEFGMEAGWGAEREVDGGLEGRG